ncbi:MAG TPA: YCF48-related protein [Terriglobales bacterium]|nr:YCF48-related protein [Terriglobales bacterium]
MAEVPKIVRQRMVATAKPGPHPDPDLLTAFAEQSLSRRDRNLILAHLAQCAECREVLVLSTPLSEAVPQPSATRTRWLGWPALRWGALAACAALVAAVSLRQGVPPTRPAGSVQAVHRLGEPVPPPQAPVAFSIQEDRVAMGNETRIVRPKSRQVAVAPRSPAMMAKISPPATADKSAPPVPEMQLANKATALSAAPPVQANEQVEVTAEAASAQTGASEAMLGKAKEAQGNMDLSLEKERAAKSEVAPAVAGAFPARRLIPRWTLSADGTLERSLDAGRTWKTIPVATDATLTAVAAMDSDIWVGGSRGALYHSTDAGDHWTQVTPNAGGQKLTANIIGIEFSDMLHGKITTANQEIWTTTDAGQTWQTSH